MDLFYRKYGEGKPVIILHGLFGMSDNWMTVGKQLAENNFCMYIPDQRNHGESPRSDEFNYDLLADDLNEFINQHKISDPVIIGHSMGGKAALTYVQKHKNNVRKLIIVDIGTKRYTSIIEFTLDSLVSVDIGNLRSRSEIEDKLIENIKYSRVRQLMMKNVRRIEPDHFDWKFNLPGIKNNLSKMQDALYDSKKYSGPVLFVRGGLSDYIKNEDIPGIKELFPGAEFQTIEGASHWVHADKPIEFLKLIKDFILSN